MANTRPGAKGIKPGSRKTKNVFADFDQELRMAKLRAPKPRKAPSLRKLPPTLLIGKKRFRLIHDPYQSKAAAQRRAKEIRSSDCNVRVIKVPNAKFWVLYEYCR